MATPESLLPTTDDSSKEFSSLVQILLFKMDSMRELLEEKLMFTNKDLEEIRKDLSKYVDLSQENAMAIHEIRTKLASDVSDVKERYKSIENKFSDISDRIDNIESKLDVSDGKELSIKKMMYIFIILTSIVSIAASFFSSFISKFINI